MPSLNIYIDNEGSDHCNQKNPKKRKNNLIGLSIFFAMPCLKSPKKNHLIVYLTLIFLFDKYWTETIKHHLSRHTI